ncbi:ABC transporter substrate-binding protein [Mesorhizobium sp. GR13]|uniref:ABC transporter substrate-binding protein n=1 Tax=Mesorhizobium sp. GR13 TaxID=2562308 RepID=UPI0010C09EC1|nr:ABC transporter substrate-binding protein [Mesorhizobium sp. GR13]
MFKHIAWFRLAVTVAASLLPGTGFARDVVDMTGRKVTVPDVIERVVTIGAVPVINSYVFAVGKAKTLAMALPSSFDPALSAFQFVFAPQLATNPQLQDANGPDLEKLLSVRPDVVLSFEQATADLLTRNGISVILLRIGTPDEVKAGVALIAEALGNPEVGPKYAAYFDDLTARVAAKVAKIPEEKRPTVLYMNPANMTQPHVIAEWWIPAGGGRSVTNDGRTQNVLPLTTEAVVGANPDYIFVQQPSHVGVLRADPVLSQLDAVKNNRVIVSPRGAHVWGNRAVDLVLTPLWVATVLHPDAFPREELIAESKHFYSGFFKTELSNEQVEEILSGGWDQSK